MRPSTFKVITALLLSSVVNVSMQQQVDMSKALVILGVSNASSPPDALYKLFGNPEIYVPMLADEFSTLPWVLDNMTFSPYNAMGSIAVDYYHNAVLYGNDSNRHLQFGNFIINVTTVEYFIPRLTVSDEILAVAFDWISQNLYWLDGVNMQIGVVAMTRGTNFTHYSTIVVSDVVNPEDMAVDPVNGMLFWTSGKCGATQIMQSSLDGENVTVLQNPTKIANCYIRLAVDVDAQILFWLDALNERLGCISYSDEPGVLVSAANSMLATMTSMTTFGNYVVLCSSVQRTVNFFNMTTFDLEATTFEFEYPLVDIATYAAASQPIPSPGSPCLMDNGGCSQLCFSTSPTTSVCGCQTGYYVQADGTSCGMTPMSQSSANAASYSSLLILITSSLLACARWL